MNEQADYQFIRTWGRLVGSYDDYIEDRVALARREGAPPNAIYRQEDGTWITTDDITSAMMRLQLGLDPLPPREPDLATIVTDIANAIRLTESFRDLFGLNAIQRPTEHTLTLQFSTGWSARIELRLEPPSTAL